MSARRTVTAADRATADAQETYVAATRRRLAPLTAGGPGHNREVARRLAAAQVRLRRGDFPGAVAEAQAAEQAAQA